MNAVTLSELNLAGIVATVAGGKLRLSAPAGRLTPDLRERIARNRDALLRELDADLRAHLLALAADEGLSARLVHDLDDVDVAACAGLPDRTLRAYLRALERGQRMDEGQVPPDYNAIAYCEVCGPIHWHRVERLKACPWCFRRRAGKAIPRPLVTCDDCRHSLPDTVNPAAGMGGCELGSGRAYWPMKLHRCADWRPKGAAA